MINKFKLTKKWRPIILCATLLTFPESTVGQDTMEKFPKHDFEVVSDNEKTVASPKKITSVSIEMKNCTNEDIACDYSFYFLSPAGEKFKIAEFRSRTKIESLQTQKSGTSYFNGCKVIGGENSVTVRDTNVSIKIIVNFSHQDTVSCGSEIGDLSGVSIETWKQAKTEIIVVRTEKTKDISRSDLK